MTETPRTEAIDAANDGIPTIDAYAMMRGHARRLERELAFLGKVLGRVIEQRDDAEAEIRDLRRSLQSADDHAFYQDGVDGR